MTCNSEPFLIADGFAEKEANMKKRLIFATMFIAVFTASVFDMMLESRAPKVVNSGN